MSGPVSHGDDGSGQPRTKHVAGTRSAPWDTLLVGHECQR